MDAQKPDADVQFKFWFHKGHGLLRRRGDAGPFGHPEIWNGRRWLPGSPTDLDAITGMGEDPWSCGEYADEWDLKQAQEYAALHGFDLFAPDPDPVPNAEWEVWYRDTFDRECPPKVDVHGYGLVKGLMELWARHLFEALDGFSRFDLLWKQKNTRIEITGDRKGAALLRTWMFGAKETADRGYIAEADINLLESVAITHAKFIVIGKTSEALLGKAAAAVDREDFEKQLSTLTAQ
jgi:hypothetical protein